LKELFDPHSSASATDRLKPPAAAPLQVKGRFSARPLTVVEIRCMLLFKIRGREYSRMVFAKGAAFVFNFAFTCDQGYYYPLVSLAMETEQRLALQAPAR
jgi:hypothetical protein